MPGNLILMYQLVQNYSIHKYIWNLTFCSKTAESKVAQGPDVDSNFYTV